MNEKPSSAYQPPAVAPVVKKAEFWAPDPWAEHSEEFYRSIYAGGKCIYCGHIINTHLDICACDGMKKAREEFKRRISYRPAPVVSLPIAESKYNPDEHIEPQQEFEYEPEV